MLNSYDTENSLIEAFLNTVVYEHDPLNIDGFSREFDYRSGRTDIIFRTTMEGLFLSRQSYQSENACIKHIDVRHFLTTLMFFYPCTTLILL